ncbi:mechanosensitive ion channel [Nocardioides sp. B-3]|uniref:mechanosensitive ion channel n=1 Tax=Nocardioides sp. B-3 TaxID=2895565 RepID=UPI002152DA7B|nr:mechanosensitive ion channel [Nocardioides sp. B-3]UUZ61294.1 mechanosensitive ion channel [Nocardioides sp. B-3]
MTGSPRGSSLGTAASLLVWLFGPVAILRVFALDRVLEPIQTLLTRVMEFLPNLIGALFVFFIGALVAKVVRQLIETALGAVPFERWFSSARSTVDKQTGTGTTTTGTTTTAYADGSTSSGLSALPKTPATVVYALIMIVVAIAALQIPGIKSISDPAEQMLTTIFDTIPLVIAAALILGIGVMIARFAGDILEQVLDGFGTDRALTAMEVLPEGKSATPVIAKVARVAIVLFFAVMAAQCWPSRRSPSSSARCSSSAAGCCSAGRSSPPGSSSPTCSPSSSRARGAPSCATRRSCCSSRWACPTWGSRTRSSSSRSVRWSSAVPQPAAPAFGLGWSRRCGPPAGAPRGLVVKRVDPTHGRRDRSAHLTPM